MSEKIRSQDWIPAFAGMTAKSGTDRKQPSPPPSRARTLVFVVVFLISSFVLLTASRLAIGTRMMDGYLYVVASHTAWVLGLLGESGVVENIADYGGREREVRAALGKADAEDAPDVAPLTPWEVYSYRMGRLRDSSINVMQEEGPHVSYVANAGMSRRFDFILVPECGALSTMAIYVAAILAFPARWRKRLIGVLLGLPLLYAVNVARLACLAIVGAYTRGGPWLDFAHKYVWQGIYVIFVVVLWLLWMELVVRAQES